MKKIEIVLGYLSNLEHGMEIAYHELNNKGITFDRVGHNVISTNSCKIFMTHLDYNYGFEMHPIDRGIKCDISFALLPKDEIRCNKNHKYTPEGINCLDFVETVEKKIPERILDQLTKDEVIDIAVKMIRTNASFINVFYFLPRGGRSNIADACRRVMNMDNKDSKWYEENFGYIPDCVKQYENQMERVSNLAADTPCPLRIEKVIFNDPATIVLWTDGTKSVVKAYYEDFDKEKGLAMAISKKMLGTNDSGSNYYDEFKKWITEDEECSYDSLVKLAEMFTRTCDLYNSAININRSTCKSCKNCKYTLDSFEECKLGNHRECFAYSCWQPKDE